MNSPPLRRSSTFQAIRTSAKRVSAKILNPLRSTSRSRARLSRILLFYWLGVVAVVILARFSFSSQWLDLAARVLLFIPLGFLFPLTLQGRNPKPLPVLILGLLAGGISGIALSETEDLLLVSVASGLGAGAGAYLLESANQRIANSGRLAGRLSLEIPLVALVYMLLPTLVAASLAASADPLTAISLIPLGLLGSRLIAAVYEHHFAPGGVFRHRSIVVVAAGWMTLGVFPLLFINPAVGGGLVALAALTTWRAAAIPAVHIDGAERRFEADTLRKSVPAVSAYFLLAIALPLSGGKGITLLSPVTSLAMLGYVLAEARGRRELSFLKTAPRIAAECGGVALAMEVSRVLQAGAGFSVFRLVIVIAAGVLGAGIYHGQRERLQHILIHRPSGPSPSMRIGVGREVVVRS